MGETLLALERRSDGVAVLTLDRPEKRNALSKALRDEIVQRLSELEADASIRVAVLTGAGPAFCAGFDRDELASGRMDEIFAGAVDYHRRVYTFPKPLIAAVNGPALGGGCDLAALCDVRIAARSATFGQPQVRFGAPALYELMRAVVGTGAAREMCLSGRTYDAREALSIGLVNRVVHPEQLQETALALAAQIAALPPSVLEQTKRSFLEHQPRLFGS